MKTSISKRTSLDETQFFPRHTVGGMWFDFQIKKQSPKGSYFVTVVFDTKKEAQEFISQFNSFADVLAWEANVAKAA